MWRSPHHSLPSRVLAPWPALLPSLSRRRLRVCCPASPHFRDPAFVLSSSILPLFFAPARPPQFVRWSSVSPSSLLPCSFSPSLLFRLALLHLAPRGTSLLVALPHQPVEPLEVARAKAGARPHGLPPSSVLCLVAVSLAVVATALRQAAADHVADRYGRHQRPRTGCVEVVCLP